MNKFSCGHSGMCCSHIRGILSPEDSESITDLGYGALPLFYFVQPEKISFPLWDFEAKRLKTHAKTHNASIKPLRGLFDLSEQRTIVVAYFMDHNQCPFHTHKNCSVYEERPLICQQFPLQSIPHEFPSSLTPMLGACPTLSESIKNVTIKSSEEVDSVLDQHFSKELLDAVTLNERIAQFVNATIITLMKERIVRPAMNYPYDLLLQKVEQSDSIDFFDYLREKDIKISDDIPLH